MRVTYTGFELNPAGAQLIKHILDGDRSSPGAENLVAHLTDIGAKFAVLEDPYIDRDYSSDYVHFYATAFKDHARHARRFHLFSRDVSDNLKKPLAEQVNDKDIAAAYLGFVVVRPIRQGPIGRSIIRFPDSTDGLCIRDSVRATSHAHIFGIKLEIAGAPFIQQDQRLGACAQAAIWMASRPIHLRHRRTPWHSIADITRLATTPTDAELSQELPAGSTGLNPLHIIRALKAMEHQPLYHCFRDAGGNPTEVVAREVAFRYLDSGLPVVLCLSGEGIAHAVTAVGYVEVDGSAVFETKTYDAFVRAFVVHDDQRGPYRFMPLTRSDADRLPRDRLLMNKGDVLILEEIASHMFVPLPPRVLLRAERAHIVARDFLERHSMVAPKLASEATEPGAKVAIQEFHEKAKAGNLILRTYLTSAGRYRHHLAKSDLNDEIKKELIVRQLPHFIWISEVMEPNANQTCKDGPRRILGHMVVNATSSTDPNNDLLMAHFPNVVTHHDINPSREKMDEVEFEEDTKIFPEDAPYLGRVRGMP